MKVVKGDLIELGLRGDFDVIVHGCNCECTMEHGIARRIRDRIPAAHDADSKTLACDPNKMGSFSYAVANGEKGHKLVVVNGYIQLRSSSNRGPKMRLLNYKALRSVMKHVKENFRGHRIGYPMIGSELANCDWSEIEAIIDEELSGEDHTVVLSTWKEVKEMDAVCTVRMTKKHKPDCSRSVDMAATSQVGQSNDENTKISKPQAENDQALLDWLHNRLKNSNISDVDDLKDEIIQLHFNDEIPLHLIPPANTKQSPLFMPPQGMYPPWIHNIAPKINLQSINNSQG